MYLIRLPTTGTPPRSSSSLASPWQHARPYLILTFSPPRASPVNAIRVSDACSFSSQEWRHSPAGREFFFIPFPFPLGFPFPDGLLARSLQVAINFPSARERVLPVAINQATSFNLAQRATPRILITKRMSLINGIGYLLCVPGGKTLALCTMYNDVFCDVMDAHFIFYATWRFPKSLRTKRSSL